MDLGELIAVALACKTRDGSLPSTASSAPTTQHVGVLSKERFAEAIGVPVGIVGGWVERGLVPTLKLGKHRLINIALLQQTCSDREFHDRGALFLSAAMASAGEHSSHRRRKARRNANDDAA